MPPRLVDLAKELQQEIEKNESYVLSMTRSRKPMRSRSWPSASAAACATFSLLAAASRRAAAQTPAIALVDPADAPQWQAWTKETGWRVITGAAADNPDARALALATAVRDAIRDGVDPARVYLAGRGRRRRAGVLHHLAGPRPLGRRHRHRRLARSPPSTPAALFTANFT